MVLSSSGGGGEGCSAYPLSSFASVRRRRTVGALATQQSNAAVIEIRNNNNIFNRWPQVIESTLRRS
jgi:hypothetical protein